MINKCLIVSSKFHAGHWSHILATYFLFNELGFDTRLKVNERFLALNSTIEKSKFINFSISDVKIYKVVIILFPDFRNFFHLFKFKLLGNAKVIYVFHEPIDTYSSFINSGFNWLSIIKLFIINQLNKFILIISTNIILPSNTSFLIYEKKYKIFNQKYTLIPLFFIDENPLDYKNNFNRKFISYIGTIANDHAFGKFVNFVKFAFKNNLFKDYIFLICTSSKLDAQFKKELIEGDHHNILIIEGKWLSNDEINGFYKNSLVVWNAYDRSAQSGVLCKSFMFACPVLGNSIIPNEYIQSKLNGIYLMDSTDCFEISNAITEIIANIDFYSLNSRLTFLKYFYYKNYIPDFDIICKDI